MSINSFITDLQHSSNNRKLRWLIGLTVLSMAIIIGVWALATPPRSNVSGELVRKDDQPTFLSKVALGARSVVDTLRAKTANTINFFTHKFAKTNTIEVEVTNETETKSQ